MIRIGISGWRYEPWRGIFYPRGLAQRRELEYASRKVATIEINGTFYSTQLPSSFARWKAETPEGFVFAVKGPRYITHFLRLKGAEKSLDRFFGSGVLSLGRKLGPVLWQLPPNMLFDAARLRAFLELLPRDVRHAFEPRHASFADPAFAALLREFGAALVLADTARAWPSFDESTADFSYLRLHGDVELYASGYGPKALDAWAERVRRRARGGRDVFVYFDNDVKVRAPYDAMSLAARLGLGPDPGPRPPLPKDRPLGPRAAGRPFMFFKRRTESGSARPSPRTRRRTAAPRRGPSPRRASGPRA